MYITSRVDHWKSCIGSIWRQTVILGRMRNDGFLSLIVPVPTSRVLAGQRGRCGNCGCLWCKPQFGHDLWPTFYTDKHFIKCICCDVGGEKLVVAINPTDRDPYKVLLNILQKHASPISTEHYLASPSL